MGQITIEIPQSVNRDYEITLEELAKEILLFLDKLVKENKAVLISEEQLDTEENTA